MKKNYKLEAISKINEIKSSKSKKVLAMGLCFLIVISLIGIVFVGHNENYYAKTIGKITEISEKNFQNENSNGSKENMKKQQVVAVIMNGQFKGHSVNFENTNSYSQINDLDLKVKDEVFLSVIKTSDGKISSVKLLDLKRDKYLIYIIVIFAILMIVIAGKKGLRSLASVAVNLVIFFVAIQLFLIGVNIALIAIVASILFIIFSVLIVQGINEKAVSAIIGTAAGTLISMLIAVLVIELTKWNGIHFEEMEFLTHPPEQIFLVEILIGTLGGIMDIAISISSCLKEIVEKNPSIDKKSLMDSGMEVGRDIMGTMANTLVFAYISGSIPILLLLLRNGYPIFYIININLSLEFVRALTGSIGVVLSIPITIYTSVTFYKNYKIGQVHKL